MKRKKHNIQANLGLGGNSEMNVIMWIHRMSNIESLLYTQNTSHFIAHTDDIRAMIEWMVKRVEW